MIYVTHDQVEAMTLGQRIVVMNHGVVQQIDTPMKIYAHPANLFVAGFLGNPAMNLWRGQLKSEGAVLSRANQTHALPLGRGAARVNGRADVVVGVRPENVHRIAAHDRSHEIRFDAAVDLVESVGSEAFIHARYGDWTVVVRVSPHDLPAPGTTVTLGIAPETLHFFDASTGGRID